MKTIIAASRNINKIREMEEILSKYGMEVISRDDAGIPKDEVEETGETFEENSYIKAKAVMDMCGQTVIADDSGLSVDCLNGAPGVRSARFAGEECNDSDNIDKLLSLMEGVPDGNRGARFETVITMLFPDGRKIVSKGVCRGKIIRERRGDEGFGYDPVFVPEGYNRTFAQLDAEEKNQISHRGKALENLDRKFTKQDN